MRLLKNKTKKIPAIYQFLSFSFLASLSFSSLSQLTTGFDVELGMQPQEDGTYKFEVENIYRHGRVERIPLSIEYNTKEKLVPATFGTPSDPDDTTPHKTDNPGWTMPYDERWNQGVLWYRALGKLEYWSPETQTWGAPITNGETITLFGGIPADVIFRDDPEEMNQYRHGTKWGEDGIQGPKEMVVQGLNTPVHIHKDFCIADANGVCLEVVTRTIQGPPWVGTITETSYRTATETDTGDPAVGAYRIRLQLFAKSGNGELIHEESEPYSIVFRQGISEEQFIQALNTLTELPDNNLEAKPAPGILIMN